MNANHDIERIRSAVAHDRNGDRIGGIGDVYLDDQTGEPTWVTVNTGLFGMKTTFVPMAGARFDGDDRLVLAYDKELVKDAPQMDEDGHLDRSQEDDLYRYYQVEAGQADEGRLRNRRWDDAAAGAGAGMTGAAYDRDRGLDDDRDLRDDDRGGMFDRDADGRGPVGEVLDGPDGSESDRRGDVGLDPHRDDSGLPEDYDRGAPTGEGGLRGQRVDRPVDEGYADDRRDGPLLDSDRDGRGPIEEVIDGPDDPRNPRRN